MFVTTPISHLQTHNFHCSPVHLVQGVTELLALKYPCSSGVTNGLCPPASPSPLYPVSLLLLLILLHLNRSSHVSPVAQQLSLFINTVLVQISSWPCTTTSPWHRCWLGRKRQTKSYFISSFFSHFHVFFLFVPSCHAYKSEELQLIPRPCKGYTKLHVRVFLVFPTLNMLLCDYLCDYNKSSNRWPM